MSTYLPYIQSLLAPLATANLKLAPMNDGYGYDPVNNATWADVSFYKAADPVTLTGVSLFLNDADDPPYVGLLFDDVQFGSLEDDVTGVLLYLDTGDDSTSPLIAHDFFDTNIDSTIPFAYSPYDQGFLQVYGVDPSEIG